MRSIKRAIRAYCGIVIIFGMLIGCNFTPPDLLIQPIHPQEISGQYGYSIILPTGGSDVAAFRILNWYLTVFGKGYFSIFTLPF